jgi:hypothetical protein
MAKLTTKRRKALKPKVFGLPKERKYPMPDKSHAVNAKGRAQQEYDKGALSKSTLEKIDAKANKILKKKGAKTISGKPVKKTVKKTTKRPTRSSYK